MKVTVVIITRDRPVHVKRLIDSLICSEKQPFTYVLINDSKSENFKSIENHLHSHTEHYVHKSSVTARKDVESTVERGGVSETVKTLVETCIGVKSPFLEFASSLPKIDLLRNRFIPLLSQSFGPYSTARNLGIFCAHTVFNPEQIVFLDDDCYFTDPKRLTAALQLIGQKIMGKEIVAVSGLYEDLSFSSQREKHTYEEAKPDSILTGMNSFLKRSFLKGQQQRLTYMPQHALGGTLILSKKVFLSLPFDPFIPRGEDHAYCIDFTRRYGKDLAIVRDNLYLVKHNSDKKDPNVEEKNRLRDIFRFVYLHAKTGRSFIPHFTFRWTLRSLLCSVRNPTKSPKHLLDLWALIFLARSYAKRNGGQYYKVAKAWNTFLKRSA